MEDETKIEEVEEAIEEKDALPETDIETLKLQEELREHKDKYVRLLAENENARKRMQKERDESRRFAMERIIVDFLGPLDNFENALGFAEGANEETRNWAMGFKMILTQFQDILQQHHFRPFHAEGKQFDPHYHEAIEIEETDAYEDGAILKEFSKGYCCGERVVRPAKVKVAKHPQKEEEENNQEENKEKSEDN